MRIGIAIVDDNAIELMKMKAILSQYTQFKLLLTAKNGKELIDGLAQLDVLPEVCIIDYHMPIMNGADTVKILIERYPEILNYGYTSTTTPEEIDDFLRCGAKKVYSKDANAIIFEDIITLYL